MVIRLLYFNAQGVPQFSGEWPYCSGLSSPVWGCVRHCVPHGSQGLRARSVGRGHRYYLTPLGARQEDTSRPCYMESGFYFRRTPTITKPSKSVICPFWPHSDCLQADFGDCHFFTGCRSRNRKAGFPGYQRADKCGSSLLVPLLQGIWDSGYYGLVLPRARHIFVQSRRMVEDVAAHGIPISRMTPVPMGVDLEGSLPSRVAPIQDARLAGKRVVAYLGTLDRTRRIEVLFEMLVTARIACPDLMLVLAGDTEDAAHRDWLRREAQRLGVGDAVLWTGWLPTEQAWSYVRAAEVGLSPFPRGFLLDSASPTKAVEYMALGLPVVVNDNPDQAMLVEESGAGLCVPYRAETFAAALLTLLADARLRQEMGSRGQEYIAKVRGYDRIAEQVATAYRKCICES